MIYNSFDKVDSHLIQKCYENILLRGGNTAFNELSEELNSELKIKVTKNMKINFNKPKDQNSVVGWEVILFLL